MKVAQLTGPQTHEIAELPIPEINEFEVLIKIEICGLCASELHTWSEADLALPARLGHEPVGTVVETGKYVSNVSVGDRVTGLIHMAFAQFAKAHYSLITKVPEHLSLAESMGEPLGCLISGARNTPVHLGDRIAIVGLGYMGLGFLQLMKLKGASHITGFDVRPENYAIALQLGADEAKHLEEVNKKDKVLEFGKNMEGGFDVVVEASGTSAGLEFAGQIAGVHKILSIVGYHQGAKREIDMCLWNWKALTVINAHERRSSYMLDCINRGLDLVINKRIQITPLLTNSYLLKDIDHGLKEFKDKKSGYIKGYVEIQP